MENGYRESNDTSHKDEQENYDRIDSSNDNGDKPAHDPDHTEFKEL